MGLRRKGLKSRSILEELGVYVQSALRKYQDGVWGCSTYVEI